MLLSDTTLPDVELVELARSGDRSAFDELLRRHDSRMRGLAYKLMADRHRMDDALQEAYLKAYRALPRFRPGSDFGTVALPHHLQRVHRRAPQAASATPSPPRTRSTRCPAGPAPSGW